MFSKCGIHNNKHTFEKALQNNNNNNNNNNNKGLAMSLKYLLSCCLEGCETLTMSFLQCIPKH
jgi:hypothetical protein